MDLKSLAKKLTARQFERQSQSSMHIQKDLQQQSPLYDWSCRELRAQTAVKFDHSMVRAHTKHLNKRARVAPIINADTSQMAKL
jgi:hypothetical protein